MNEAQGEAVIYIALGLIITPVSIAALGFTVSLLWLAWGIFGFILAGIAGAIGIFGPWCLYEGKRRYSA